MPIRYLFFVIALSMPATLLSAPYLAPLPSGFGPYDYSDLEQRSKLVAEVEKYHFDEAVQQLQRGMNSSVWGDLNYTLRAFPNHHRALEAMARLLRMKKTYMSPELERARYEHMPIDVKVDDYFEHARDFAPHDPIVHMLYGIHLHKTKRHEHALKSYLRAEELGMKNADLHYNLGLLYTEMKDYDKAMARAERAYRLGHPLKALRNRLVRAGAWKQS